jgi:hypothetical protein
MSAGVYAQCTNYTINVTPGAWAMEVSWEILNSSNNIVASGLAPANQVVCLPDGCYTLNMYDSFGDGWNGAVLTMTGPSANVVLNATISTGTYGFQSFSLGGVNCCPAGSTAYQIDVTTGIFPTEVSWELYNSFGILIATGGAPAAQTVCLEADCYTLYMYDSFGDGWNGSVLTLSQGGTVVYSGTINTGDYNMVDISINGAPCSPACAPGEESYHIVVTSGFYPGEVGWVLYDETGFPVSTGGAPASEYVCVHPGCYEFELTDLLGDGWDGAEYTIYGSGGLPVASGTLEFGFIETNVIEIMGADCGIVNPITASDCMNAVNICENLNFQIDPNGSGLINEIPAPGSMANPLYDYGDAILSPWGSDNYGCLRSGELNSTWMVINIWQGGLLNFTFGGLGTQAGFYDWIMYPYDPDNTCQDIFNNAVPPVRCNWNYSATGGTGLQSVIPAGGTPGNFEPPLAVATGDQYIICFSNFSSATTTVPLDFGGTAVVGCFELVLPVTLSEFSAAPHGNFVKVQWTTQSELDNDYFVVEHSLNQSDWKNIGEVDGKMFSQEKTDYLFLHREPQAGLNYYRLKQVDMNGEVIYSDVAAAEMPSSRQMVFPNPNQGVFYMPSGCPFSVHDVTGRIYSFELSFPSESITEVHLKDIQPGLYFLTSSCSDEPVRIVVR